MSEHMESLVQTRVSADGPALEPQLQQSIETEMMDSQLADEEELIDEDLLELLAGEQQPVWSGF